MRSPTPIPATRNRWFALRHVEFEAAATPVWQEAARLIVADHPYVWLYYYDIVDAVRRVRGMRVDSYGLYQNTWEWWIPKSQQRGTQPAAPDSAR